jgi:hemoglobin
LGAKVYPGLEKIEALSMGIGMDAVGNLYHELGEARLRLLVGAFYRRVRVDDLIGKMYPPDDWEGAEKRLADFLIYRFGGPQTYIEERGHPRLRGRHMPFSIGVAERDRWLELMGAAMGEVELPAEQVPVVGAFFGQIADFMRNREEQP